VQNTTKPSASARQDRVYGCQDIRWEGHRLRLLTGRLLATVEPDTQWAGMYRVRFSDGRSTDIVNLSRAKDAAVSLALTKLNTARSIERVAA
jgi:hypothetical protein